MKFKSPKSLQFASAVIVGGSVALSGTTANSGQVSLLASDGSINIQGELVEFTGDVYVIESRFGPLSIDANRVDCSGEACPEIDIASLGPVTWSVSLWGKRRAFTEHLEKLAELVAEQTNGRFRLNLSYGGLSKSRENLDGIAAGAFEMAQFGPVPV